MLCGHLSDKKNSLSMMREMNVIIIRGLLKDNAYSDYNCQVGLYRSKAVSTRHFSELGAIDRAQFAPSCPCPHGGNWNARSGS